MYHLSAGDNTPADNKLASIMDKIYIYIYTYNGQTSIYIMYIYIYIYNGQISKPVAAISSIGQ